MLASPQVVAGGLLFPEGMAVDRDGSLLVVESGTGKLLRIDGGGQVTTVADGLMTGLSGSPASPPTWALSSVAVGGDGKLYVTGDAGDIVYRLKPLPAK